MRKNIKKKKNEKKEILWMLVALVSLAVITLGISVAFFNYTKEGTTENTVTSGTITFLYTEVSGIGKGIQISDAYPMTDEQGKEQTGQGSYFDFKITSQTTSNISIPYEVTARKSNDSTLDDQVVRLYLTELNGDEEKEILLENYSKLQQTGQETAKGYTEKTIYTDKVPAKQSNYEKNFRLRMWIDEKTDFSGKEEETGNVTYPYNGKTFTLTVNVYSNGNVVTKEEEQVNPLNKKILYAPFDDIGETIPKQMLLYAPFDGVGYVNENAKKPQLPFLNSVTKQEFTVLGEKTTHSTTKTKIGQKSVYFFGESIQRLNANIPELNLGISDFTISFWIYPEKQTIPYPVIFSNEENNDLRFFIANNDTEGNISLHTGNPYITLINTGKKYKENVWTHYAIVRKDGVFTIYENGINIGSTDRYKTVDVNISNFSIGGIGTNALTSYKGYMDDFAIYNYAKYTKEFTPPTAAQTDSNLLYLNFEEKFENEPEFTEKPLTEEISQKKFSLLGDDNIEGRGDKYKFGNASLYFPGTATQRININVPELNLGTRDFTISFWIYPEKQTIPCPAIFSNEENNNLRFFIANNSTDGNISLHIGDPYITLINTGQKYKENVWTHYAIVRKDGVFTIYENGINIGSTDQYKTVDVNISNFSIGGIGTNAITPYKGYMDDFAIYNYAKYNGNFIPPNVTGKDDPTNIKTNKITIKEVVSNKQFLVSENVNLQGRDDKYKFGNASLYFPGTATQRININVPELNLGTRDFTISFWIYSEKQTMPYPAIFSNEENNDLRFFIANNDTGGYISLYTRNPYITLINTGKKYTENVWTHYAIVRKDGVFTIYENGINIGSTDQYKTVDVNISNFSIGGIDTNDMTSYKGYMDDFVIYNYAKYTNEFTPPTSSAGNLE